jgi:hypothetical protein
VTERHESIFGSQNVSMLPTPYALPNVASDALTVMPIARNNIQECEE